jgi:predicted secreted Zn-dependent protease
MIKNQFDAFGMPDGPSIGNTLRQAVLERNYKLRSKMQDARGLHTDSRCALSIPELDYYVLLQRFPDLASPDAATKTSAWKKFIRSPLSEPYRLARRTL